MLAFPFTNGLAMDKAPKHQVGEYLALYTMAFSLAHIVGPPIAMYVADIYGYNAVWWLMGAISLLILILIERLKTAVKIRDLKLKLV